MKILIDADGCPVVDITVSLADKYNIECLSFFVTLLVFLKNPVHRL